MQRVQADECRIEFADEGVTGAIVFDPTQCESPRLEWFDPQFWSDAATPVSVGGRGAAFFVDAPFGACVLRHYRRGGWAARFSTATYLWQGERHARSVAEFRLTREALRRGVPVPVPVAACYRRRGAGYRAALLMRRLPGTRTLAELAIEGVAPWQEAGQLVARMHRAGLDHADLNADNLLFDDARRGWVIDLDRSRFRDASEGWRERNLQRLLRSLIKRRGQRDEAGVRADFRVLRHSYQSEWSRA